MSYVLILTLILGTEITTVVKGFDFPVDCFYEAYSINEGGMELTGNLKPYNGAETLARCYKK